MAFTKQEREEKREIIRKALSDGITDRGEIARLIGATRSTADNMVAQVLTEHSSGIGAAKPQRVHQLQTAIERVDRKITAIHKKKLEDMTEKDSNMLWSFQKQRQDWAKSLTQELAALRVQLGTEKRERELEEREKRLEEQEKGLVEDMAQLGDGSVETGWGVSSWSQPTTHLNDSTRDSSPKAKLVGRIPKITKEELKIVRWIISRMPENLADSDPHCKDCELRRMVKYCARLLLWSMRIGLFKVVKDSERRWKQLNYKNKEAVVENESDL